DRARLLAARGLLVEADELKLPQRPLEPGAWRGMLDRSAYASAFLRAWESAAASGERSVTRHLEALDFCAASHVPGVPARTRLGSLLKALEILRALSLEAPSPPRLQSLARIAWEAGQRQEAVQALAQLMAGLDDAGDDDFREPFLCVCPEFEGQLPKGGITQWCLASALHQLERQRAYSSYWSEPGKTLTAAHTLGDLGHLTPEMERRRQLVRLRFGLQLGPEPASLLGSTRPDNLNPDYWNRRA
ncbi:MAG TPA: hypothetical protein VFP70_05435, partial [Burkholderiales bacterium]|nr:hypothetical protein [Burkholderiales bacterium]